jgi:hypothetical protein
MSGGPVTGGVLAVLMLLAIISALLVGVASNGSQGFLRGLWAGLLVGAAAALAADLSGLAARVLP